MTRAEKNSSRWKSEESAREFVAMIAWDKRLSREGPFFKELFESQGARSVLDLGCGPGRHAAMFASWGLKTWGADASPAMVKLARAHTQEKGVRARFVRASYGTLRKNIHRKFDAIINLGNSMVQVKDQKELLALMKEVKALLNPGGLFLSQTKNYDGYEEEDLEALPVTSQEEEGKATYFLRLHQRQGSRIRFYLVRLIREGSAWRVNPRMTWFYRVTRENLGRALQKAGFKRAQWYGGYDCAPFNPKKSLDLIVLARTP